ncbi:alpha/beta hydrolase [Companilactobacillus furfuricola]|uniref:alpha/beta hydrolase n=1 Tax=Companilactobacillus furfuricola TaxID=1462575 RepID=UPI001FE4B632|nr:alpha/beta hydrolase [Companilactobacillus furfuricola]
MKKMIKMMKNISIFLLFVASIITFAACSNSNVSKVSKKQGATIVPTLFFHGYGSSTNAEDQMAHAAVKAGPAKTIIKALVNNKGDVTLKGVFPSYDKHPIVEVGFENNRNSNYAEDGKWARNVVIKLQEAYHIKKFNVVGHSMGNMAIMFYVLDNYRDKKLPQLQKQVDIAGHFNGILGVDDEPNEMKLKANGLPIETNPTYEKLTALRQSDAYNGIAVLNIYGDKDDGSHSDGRVSNASSKSLRYLVSNHAKSYREEKIVGQDAQHSRLHENPQVDKLLINFLWDKK